MDTPRGALSARNIGPFTDEPDGGDQFFVEIDAYDNGWRDLPFRTRMPRAVIRQWRDALSAVLAESEGER